MIEPRRFILPFIFYIFISIVGVLLLDQIYTDSMYSNLDFLQTIVSFNHTVRYWFFIISLGVINYLFNLTYFKFVLIRKGKLDIFVNLFFNLLFISSVFYFIQIKNISVFFILFICITNSAMYFKYFKSYQALK
jgi:hypothetical protein